MATSKDQTIIAKMEKAFDEFKKQIAVLQKQGNSLIKKSLKDIEQKKIQDILDKIKQS